MKKVFLFCALFLGASAIGIATVGKANSSASLSITTCASEATHWAICVTNPDNPRSGDQERFLYGYDNNGVIWVYGTSDRTFSSPIRTAPSGRSDFRYKFMWAETVWYLPA